MTTAPVSQSEPQSESQSGPRSRSERGVTTAEYAVVTAAGCGFGAVLIQLLGSDWGKALLQRLFEFFLQMIGLG